MTNPTAPQAHLDVVFGGCGFLASAVLKRLAAAGRPVRLVTRDAKSYPKDALSPRIEVAQGDVNATKLLPTLLRDARVAFFCVPIADLAEAPGDWNALPFLAACADAGVRLVLAADISLYTTDAKAPFDEKAPMRGRTPLGDAQLEWENAALVEGLRRRFATTILRLPPLLGEGLTDEGLRDAIARARAGRVIEVRGRGEEIIERLHVDDAARACVLAADRPEAIGEILHVAGHPIRRRNFLRVLVKVAESKSDVVSVEPTEGGRRRRRDVEEAPRDFWVRSEKARRLIGYAPEISYERALRESLASVERNAASA
jgi:nucleoside-diphosphate-sugar epimerase